MNRTIALAFGYCVYALCLAAFAYLVAFVGDLGLARSIERGPSAALGTAFAIDLALLALLGLQQALFAHAGLRARWARRLPRPIERSTFLLASVLVLALLFACWRPIPTSIWRVQEPVGRLALQTLCWTGWCLVALATFLVDHRELFGLRQVRAHARGEWLPRPGEGARSLLAAVRQPMTLGLLLACWSTPHMSAGRMLFAAGVTTYALIALQLETQAYLLEQGRPRRLRPRAASPRARAGDDELRWPG